MLALHARFQRDGLVPPELVLAHQDAVEIRHGRRSLRRLAEGFLHGLGREAPFVDPRLVHRLFVLARRSALTQTRQQPAELLFALSAHDDDLLHVVHRADAALRPFLRAPVRNLDGDAPPAVFHLDLEQHQHDLFRQLEHLNPVVDEVGLLRQKRPFEDALGLPDKLFVIQLVSRILCPCQRQLLQIGEREADGVIADLTNQPVPRPIFERALHILLLHIQILRHGGERHARRRMITEHQRVKIHLHKIARRAEHILGDKHIFHGCGIKQRGAVIKRAKRHVSSPFASFLTRSLYHRAGRIGKANKRGESASLPAARALDSLSRRVYNKIGLFCV